MDLYVIEVDGLDVAMADSEETAFSHARALTTEDPRIEVRIYRVRDGSADHIPWLPVGEAVTA